MKVKMYIVCGIIICSLFITAWARGFSVSGLVQSAKWGPQGHGQYHK